MIAVREARVADAEAIADLHIRNWRVTYPGILPAEYLAHEIVAERRTYWRQALATPNPGDFVLLIPGEASPLAFISVLRDSEPDYDAVIDNLHVEPETRRQGHGRRLLGAATERLINDGACSLCLWVFDANLHALRFYEHLAAQADRHGVDDFAGANAPHTRVGWHDLSRLREDCT